jgi:hypothetical protein
MAGDAIKVFVTNPADVPVPISGDLTTTIDGSVNVKTATGESVDIFIQDQTSETVDYHLSQIINAVTLAVNTTIEDTAVTLTAGHGMVAGNYLELVEGIRFYQAQVTNVNVNVITLDTPLDFAFTTAAAGNRVTVDMDVDGSLANPEIFSIVPPAGVKWDIVRIIFVIQGDAAMDSRLFGSLPALTNGIVVRSVNSTQKAQFNCKSNGEFAEIAYDIAYDDRAGVAAGIYAFRCRRTWGSQGKTGVVIRLDGDEGGELQHLVQDDLLDAAMISYHARVQGHIVED